MRNFSVAIILSLKKAFNLAANCLIVRKVRGY